MKGVMDAPTKIREGEELDVSTLESFLKDEIKLRLWLFFHLYLLFQ